MGAQLLIPEIRGDGTIARWVWINGAEHHLLGTNAIVTLARTPAQKLPARHPDDGRADLVRAGLAYQAMTAAYLQHEGLEARRQFRALARKGIAADRWVL